MATFTNDIEVGGHDLLWGDTPTNLGATQEGSVLTLTTKTAPLTVHRHGDTPYKEVIVGREVRLEAILLQRDVDVLADLLLGVKSTGAASDPFDIDPRPQATTTGRLELKPIGAIDDTANIVIWKASARAECSVAVKIGEEQAYKIVFTGLIEEDVSGGVRLLRIGDPEELAATKSYFPQT